MVLTPEEQASIEERFEALERRNARLERLIRSGKAFTANPLALATDLDDLGSVKTHLDFEEAPLTPVDPPVDVGRLYIEARSGVGADSVMRYIGTGGAKSELTHPPAVYARRTINQTISTASWTAMALNGSELFDTDSLHSTSTNNERLTVNSALGIYSIDGWVSWAVNATGRRAIRVLLNGSASLRQITDIATDATIGNDQGIHLYYNLETVGDYVELQGWQSSGGDLVADNAHFAMTWVAPASS